VFGCDGEIKFKSVKNEARAKRAFLHDCVDDARRDGEDDAPYRARGTAQEARFESIGSREGIHVRLGSVRGKPKRLRQKEVDVLLTTDMLTHGYDGNMEKAVLIAGDLDLRPIVEALVRRGVFVEVWYEKKSGARELPGAADFGRQLAFTTLYRLSTQDFQTRCQLPHTDTAHEPWIYPVVLSRCSYNGRETILYQDTHRMTFPLRSVRSNGIWWFDHADPKVLERYFDRRLWAC
jgi:uncharacterized LabA/DUF88 family protein